MKKVLINVEERELRVAILEDDQLVEFYTESLDDKTILNNIYKGRIEGIIPGLKAAFVNIGMERNAFLHFDDVRADLLWARKRGMDAEKSEQPVSDSTDTTPSTEEIGPVTDKPTEVEEYTPSAEELAVVEALDSAPSEPVVQTVERTEGFDRSNKRRRRRRGRRGGRHRGREFDEDNAQQGGQAPESAVAGQTSSPASSEAPMVAEEDPDYGPQPGQRNDQPGQQRPSQQHPRQQRHENRRGGHRDRDRDRRPPRQHRDQQPKAPAQPEPQWLPPPAGSAAFGTRAAANPYDVFSPYAQKPTPKRPKRERQPRGHSGWTSGGPSSSANHGKDSQEDFFPPAPNTRTPNYAGPAAPYRVDDEDDYDGPAPGNEKFPEQRTGGGQPHGPKKHHPRGRSMRRRGPAQYAARVKKSDADSQEQSKASASEKKKKAPAKAAKGTSETVKPKAAARKKAPTAENAKALAKDAVGAISTELKETKPVRRSRKAEPAVAVEPTSALTKADEKKRTKKSSSEKPTSAASGENATATPVEPAPKKTRGRKAKADVDTTASAEAVTIQVKPEKPAGKARASRKKTVTEPASVTPAPTVAEAPAAYAAPAETVSVTDAPPTVSESGSQTEQETTGRPRRHRDRQRGRRGRGRRFDQKAEVQDQPQGEASQETSAADQGPQQELDASAMPSPGAEGQQDVHTGEIVPFPQPGQQRPPFPRDRKDRHRDRDRRDRFEPKKRWERPPLMTEVFKKGDEIMVQVIKEEIGLKGARISTYISVPGRYLVLLPYPNEEGGVSRKVEDFHERKRLKRLLREITQDDMAFIVRTAGVDREETEIRNDVEYLSGEWQRIAAQYEKSKPTELVYDDHDILYRLCRDVFDESIGEIIIDSEAQAANLKTILGKLIPDLVDRVQVYTEAENLFNKYQVQRQIQKACRRKVWLKSGGYLIIDEAEALTAIDVNTGKFIGKDDQEKMILKTNLEAGKAIARELKLRDIGGLIVIDFIDMKDQRNKDQVLAEFKAHLKKDRSKTSVSCISEFGLVEMTRKRVRQSLRKTLFMDCPYCQGAGVVLNEQQIWLHVKHEIIRMLEAQSPSPSLNVITSPKLRAYIDQNYRDALEKLEEKYNVEITVSMSDVFHVENYSIEKFLRAS